MIHTTILRARYGESDQMGFIHHANHVVWMELSRINLLRECGVNCRELEIAGILVPVVSVAVKYVSPAFFDDEISVQAAVTRKTRARFRVDYLVCRKNGDLLCHGHTDHCLLDKSSRKPIPIPESIYFSLRIDEPAQAWPSWRNP